MIYGAGLQLIGLVLLAIGFRQTWHTHRYGDRRSLPAFVAQPLTDRATAVARGVGSGLRRMPWRRKSVTVQLDGELPALEGRATIVASAEIGWSVLPDPAEDMDAFAAKVQERMSRLLVMVQEGQDALAREREARQTTEEEIKLAVEREVARLEALSHGVATGGLRWEIWGWLFLVGGLIVSTLAAL